MPPKTIKRTPRAEHPIHARCPVWPARNCAEPLTTAMPQLDPCKI